MNKNTNAWLDFAARDLQAARKLVNDEYIANIVLFHSQQCIEKCMKAFLEEYNLNVPEIHGVVKLHELIKENTKIILPVTDDELDLIDDIYIDTRYPGNFGLLPSGFPTKDDATTLLCIAENVYLETMKKLDK
ncbi:MAG: HEPN domain-containing protein [Candidatus Anammoxibacter sp.]